MRKTPLLLLATVFLMACGQPLSAPSEMNENEILNEQEMNAAGEVSVDFLAKAEAWDSEEIVTQNNEYYTALQPDYMKDQGQTTEDYLKTLYSSEDGASPIISFWKVGTIKNGDYAGQSLVLVRANCDGPCEPLTFRYAVDETKQQWTGLLSYSDPAMGTETLQGPGTELEASIDIAALNLPETLDIYENDPVALSNPFSGQDPVYYDLDGTDSYTEVTGPTGGPFTKYYLSRSTACLFGVTMDGVLVRYQSLPAMFGFTPASGKSSDSSYAQPNTSGDFTLLLDEGNEVIKEDHTYILTAGGCGFLGSCAITYEADAADEANLMEVGTLTRPDEGSNVGGTVYTLKTVSEDDAGSGLAAAVIQAYNAYKMGLEYRDPPETAMTTEEFLSKHEVLLIKLDSGKYVVAYDSAVAPSVECGKPVIYLYPTAAQQVSVKVNKITFSKTIPDHGQNGWTVWANPDGSLKNLADGLIYPYLFWEGQSSAKVTMGEGWTLAKKDIATKLPTALTSMGLNTKETADFMEFWLPRLQAVKTPYVLFNFEGTAAMNIVAPLTITPAPDSLLRVFMYYQGVSQAGRAMPRYTAPARTGFSVIEWGGSLY